MTELTGDVHRMGVANRERRRITTGAEKREQRKNRDYDYETADSAGCVYNVCTYSFRDMPKYLRTCQMSMDGYPADMSIFCNLQLGLLKLQEDTPQADIDQDNVSLAGVLQGAVGRAV